MAYPLIRNRHSCVARLILACLAALAVGCFCVERVAPAGVGGSACAKTFPLAAAGRPAAAKVATAEESGGVTYDFTAITERRFPIPKIGDAGNLVDAEPFFDDPWGNERKAWGKYVTLPTDKGARFRLSFWYKMRHTKGELGYAFIFYYNRDPETGKLRARDDVKASYSHYDVWVLQNEWSDWNRFSKEFTAPEGPDTVKIVIRIDGQGDLEYVDPSLVAVDATAKKPVRLTFFPQSRLDGVYQVSAGQCGMMRLSFANSGVEKIDPKSCDFVLELPPCVKLLGMSFADAKTLLTESLSNGGTRNTFRAARDSFLPQCANPTLLVGAQGAVGASDVGTLTAIKDGVAVSEPDRIRFEIVPPVRAVMPKRYMNGIFFYQREALFRSSVADRAFADLMGAAGVNWVICNEKTDEQIALWRAAGIRKITPQAILDNGYHFGNGAGRPAEDAFVRDVNAGGAKTWDGYMDKSTCPLAVIEERDYFLKTTVPALTSALNGCDGMWANWEPFMFRGCGCNCAKCDAAYAEWHAKTGGTRAKFRSYQHGLMVKTIDKYVRKATGGDKSYGFIPGVSWRTVCSAWSEKHPSEEAEPIDYAGSLNWLEPWGPYARWAADEPYNYEKRPPLAHFVVAKDMRATVDADYPAPRRPKLLSFPQGLQCDAWVTQPEHVEMACDSFFFNGFEANVLYFFPEGYDARYWKAFAAATTRAAKYEDFTWDGVRADRKTTLLPVPEYAAPCTYVTAYLPQDRDVSPLCQTTYEKDGARIVAVFNFWQKGEAYFTLRSAGLAKGDYVLFDEDGVLYPNRGFFRTWTADELARGVFLAVGASRTKVFEIRPDARPFSFTSAHTQEALRQRHRARKGALAVLAAEDAVYEDANREERKDAKSEL